MRIAPRRGSKGVVGLSAESGTGIHIISAVPPVNDKDAYLAASMSRAQFRCADVDVNQKGPSEAEAGSTQFIAFETRLTLETFHTTLAENLTALGYTVLTAQAIEQ